MKKIQAIQIVRDFDQKGKFVFTKHDFNKLFPEDNPRTLDEGLNRLVKDRILIRACRGIYVNEYARSKDSYIIEHIAKALRRGEYNYVSLESMLSEYGIISQIPIDRLTVMTTGRSGIYKTPYGIIEFTHTKRSPDDILSSVQKIKDRPLRVATKQAAIRDLKRVGRNLDLMQLENDNDD
ncbi:MAG: hypothetical protein U1E78_01635 [Gammaproteobacteria bacterium]